MPKAQSNPALISHHILQDPFTACFIAVVRSLKGKPGLIPAMQAIVAEKRRASHV